jgi:hypothetical protein
MRYTLGKGNYLYIHLTLVPYIQAADELKTKPTQHSVKELLSIGIQPNILVCRSDRPIPKEMKRKIALFCNVEENCVITAQDVDTIYEVPIHLHEEGLDDRIVEALELKVSNNNLKTWETIVERIKHPSKSVTIALVGKYIDLKEAYKALRGAHPRGHRQRRQGQYPLGGFGGHRSERRGEDAHGHGRHPRAGRFRHTRGRGKNRRGQIRPGRQGPVLRHLPRHAVRGDRGRQGPRASSGREQLGVRPQDAAPRHLSDRTVV